MSVTTKEPQAAQDQLSSPPDLEATKSYDWEISLFERNGNCWLGWKGTAPFRAHEGMVALYKDKFPTDPRKDRVRFQWDMKDSPFDTGQPWGSGWCAARSARVPNSDKTVYIVKTDVTTRP